MNLCRPSHFVAYRKGVRLLSKKRTEDAQFWPDITGCAKTRKTCKVALSGKLTVNFTSKEKARRTTAKTNELLQMAHQFAERDIAASVPIATLIWRLCFLDDAKSSVSQLHVVERCCSNWRIGNRLVREPID